MVRTRKAHTLRSGFTLVEVLVSVVIFLIIMVLLLRGVEAVSTTVTKGQRQSEMYRVMKSAKRVMEEDFRSMLSHPEWNCFIGDADEDAPQLMAAFLRYRVDTEGETETEWVQYWREVHDSEPRLEKWVRYAGPATDRSSTLGDWWESVDRSALSGETVLDDLVKLDLEWITSAGPVSGSVEEQVDAVDLRFFVTVPPFPEVTDEDLPPLQRMWDENASWMHLRVVPENQRGPEITWAL